MRRADQIGELPDVSRAAATSARDVLRPTAPGERLLQLDVLRGLALFGVLVVNVGAFSGSDLAIENKIPYPTGWGGALPGLVRNTLIESKAAALLAMLFGAGLAMQWGRASTTNPLVFALRRAGALAVLGVAHTFLLWNCDILFDYALISLMVLPFLNVRTSRTLWAIPVLLVVTLLFAAGVSRAFGPAGPPPWSYELGLVNYGSGSWLQALRFRAWETIHVVGPMRLVNRLVVLTPFFILGVYFWKKRFFAEPGEHLRSLRRLFYFSFVFGLLTNLVQEEALVAWVAAIPLQPLRIVIKVAWFVGRPWLTIGYATGILLLLQKPRWRALLACFAPLGRTTLTQYLLQSVVCTWIFNGYGLGLYGKVSINACLLGAVIFFAVQVWTSGLWLERFRMGPVEWLWRRMAYGPRRTN
jgi:uncharacterized protein